MMQSCHGREPCIPKLAIGFCTFQNTVLVNPHAAICIIKQRGNSVNRWSFLQNYFLPYLKNAIVNRESKNTIVEKFTCHDVIGCRPWNLLRCPVSSTPGKSMKRTLRHFVPASWIERSGFNRLGVKEQKFTGKRYNRWLHTIGLSSLMMRTYIIA